MDPYEKKGGHVLFRLFILSILIVSVTNTISIADDWRSGLLELLSHSDSLVKVAKYDSALTVTRQAYDICIREGIETDSIAIETLIKLGAYHFYLSSYDSAEVYWSRSSEFAERKHGRINNQVARSLLNLGILKTRLGNNIESERICRNVLEIQEELFGKSHPNLTSSLNSLATTLWQQGRYVEAEEYFLRDVEIVHSEYGDDSHEMSRHLHNLGSMYFDWGRYPDAERVLSRVLELMRKYVGDMHPTIAMVLNNLGTIYLRKAQYVKAEDAYFESLKIKENVYGSDHSELITTLVNIGTLYEALGRYPEAEPYYDRALRISEEIFGTNHFYPAAIYANLGGLYHKHNRLDEAETAYVKSISAYEQSVGEDYAAVLTVKHLLSNIYNDRGDLEKAVTTLEDVRSRTEANRGEFHPDLILLLSDLADLYMQVDRDNDAMLCLERAYDVARSNFEDSHPLIAIVNGRMSRFLESKGEFDSALSYARQSLEIDSTMFGLNHPKVAYDFERIGDIMMSAGEFESARSMLNVATRLGMRVLEENAFFMSEENALGYAAKCRLKHQKYMKSILSGQSNRQQLSPEEALTLINSKGVVTRSLSNRHRWLCEQSNSKSTALLDSLYFAKSALSSLFTDSEYSFGDDYIQTSDSLNNLIEEIETRIGYSGMDAVSAGTYSSPYDIAAVIPESGTAILEFIRGEKSRVPDSLDGTGYSVLVLSSNQAPQLVWLGYSDTLDAAIRDYSSEMAMLCMIGNESGVAAEDNALKLCTKLYQIIWAPIEDLLDGADTVYISPDAQLGLISFATLCDTDGHFLIEDYAIRYLPAARDYCDSDTSSVTGDGILLVGNPEFDLDLSTYTIEEDSEMAGRGASDYFVPSLVRGGESIEILPAMDLPGTEKEILMLDSMFTELSNESVVLLNGADATEGRFCKNVTGKRIVHIATHGFYQDPVETKENTRSAFIQNPLLLSGILFAGCNKQNRGMGHDVLDNGVLSALEIASLNLDGVELVVLSACNTGLGEIHAGEGIRGLRRAFQIAGADLVMSTLWYIPDESIPEMMTQAYSTRLDNFHDALRASQIRMIESEREGSAGFKPYLWGAFVIYGN